MQTFDLLELLDLIDTKAGMFTMCFYAQSEADRKKARSGSSRFRHLGEELRGDLVSHDTSTLSSVLGNLLPSNLLLSAIQEISSRFRYVHCEAAFYPSEKGKAAFGKDSMVCLVVQKKAPVHLVGRKFSSSYTNYDWINIAADSDQLIAIVAHCHELQGQRFSDGAMAKCMSTPGPDLREKWYCSYLCATLLEFLDVPEAHLNRLNTLTIDDLHAIVSNPDYRPENDGRLTPANINKCYDRLAARFAEMTK